MQMPLADAALNLLEQAGRTCYKSEEQIKEHSAPSFVRRIIASGHLSVVEHISITVRFICDRGVSHELVRHRLAAFSQESTRYANYSQDKFGGELTFIRPLFWADGSELYHLWLKAMAAAEEGYLKMLALGASPQQARSLLPNSLTTEVVMTANLREWLHVLDLRCHAASHPQMRELMLPLLVELGQRQPEVFGDLASRYATQWEQFQNSPGRAP
jgi:thymidylate synthase (FAD)